MGSSLKACVVAEGKADLYPASGPHPAGTLRYSLGGHGGMGRGRGSDGKSLDYDLVEDVLNPFFLVTSDNRWNETWVEAQ